MGEGLIAPSLGAYRSPEFEEFVEAFRAEFDDEPWLYAQYTYDAVWLAAKSIEMGGYTADGIRDSVMSVAEEYVGASGPKKMGANQRCTLNLGWVQWKDGEMVDYTP